MEQKRRSQGKAGDWHEADSRILCAPVCVADSVPAHARAIPCVPAPWGSARWAWRMKYAEGARNTFALCSVFNSLSMATRWRCAGCNGLASERFHADIQLICLGINPGYLVQTSIY